MFEYKGRFFKTFTSPRGYLIDYRNVELLRFFTKKIKKFIKQKGGIYLNIEPNVLYKDFITNSELKQKIEISEKIDALPNDKIQALYKIIDVLKDL